MSRGMVAIIGILLIGQVRVSRGDSPVADPLFKDVDILWQTPIPGETAVVPRLDGQDLERLLGNPILLVEAPDAPAGFDPVKEADVPENAHLTRPLARQVILSLFATGHYSNIHLTASPYGNGGVRLRIYVVPMYRISRVSIEGNSALKDAQVRRAIGFVPGMTIVPDEASLVRLQERLEREYRNRGYGDARSVLRIETTDVPGEVALGVSVDEGLPFIYRTIHISGLEDTHLVEIAARKAGLTDGIVRDEMAVETAIEDMVDYIRVRGYPDATEDGRYSEKPDGERSFSLYVRLDPGLRTDIVFEGNFRIRQRSLRESLLEDYVFSTSMAGLDRAVAQLSRHLTHAGLFHSRVRAYRRCHPASGDASVVSRENRCPEGAVSQTIVFQINEGPPVEVEDIQVSGNRFFTQKVLVEEIQAFVGERLHVDDVFETFSSHSLNRAVMGHNGHRAALPYRGTGSVLPRAYRKYVPDIYAEACEHLSQIYAEEGFLSAQISDSCDLSEEDRLVHDGFSYRPLVLDVRDVSSPGGGASVSGTEQPGPRRTPCVFIDDEYTSLLVRFSVEEGVRTLLRELSVVGNSPQVFTQARLLEVAGLAYESPYNAYRIRQGIEEIKRQYRSLGFMFADVTWSSRISDDERSASVAISIDEGPVVHVADIIINAEFTNRRYIANNLGFSSGSRMTPEALDDARRRLMEMGVFTSVTVQMHSPEIVEDTKNVVVTVVESQPQYLELRAGVATEEGVRAGFEYGHSHIGGIALNYRLRLRANYRHPDVWFLSPDAQAFKEDLEYRYSRYNAAHPDNVLPHQFRFFEWNIMTGLRTANIPGTGGILGTGVDVTFENINRRGFSALKVTPRYRITSNYLKFMPVEAWTGVDSTIVIPAQDREQLNVRDTLYQRLPSGKAVFWVSSLSWSLDFRDAPLAPKDGWFLSIKGEYVYSLFPRYDSVSLEEVVERYPDYRGDASDVVSDDVAREFRSRYIRAQGTLSKYIPFRSDRNVLALSGTAGYIFHLNDNPATSEIRPSAWADRQFYMGGVSTLRGFFADALVPQDLWGNAPVMENGDPTGEMKPVEEKGGQAMIVLRGEIRHDFGSNFEGVLFGELGNLWRNERLFLRRRTGELAPWVMRPVAGTGIHYHTPVGPLAFDVGFNLNRRPSEPVLAWYFSVGSAF